MKHFFFALFLLASSAFAQEDRLLAILKSDASAKDKTDACRELARYGTPQAVPVLAPLLADDNLSHMARYALEPIPDPAVDAALRDALGRLKGRTLAGVIHSLGVRKDRKAIEPIAKCLTDVDPVVAQAAARALGSLGGAAAPALEQALSNGAPALQLAVCEGLFRCAEAMSGAAATAIYDKLRALPNLPHRLRVAVLRGSILSRGPKGVPLLAEAIRNDSFVPALAALRIAMEMPGAEVTQMLVTELGQATEDKQLLLLQTLGNRGDASATPALLPMAQSGAINRRTTAIRSLVQLSAPTSIPVLAALVNDPEPKVSSAALTGLAGFPNNEADAALVALLRQSDAKLRPAIIDATVQRRVTAAAPVLLETASDTDAVVAGASFKALGELASMTELSAMIDALLRTQVLEAAETALSILCARQADATVCTDALLSGLSKAQGEPKLALLRVLRGVGDAKALAAVRAAAAESDASVKETALRALCDWPTVDALPDLVKLASTAGNSKIKILALRGQLRLIPMQTVTDAQKLAQIKGLLTLLERKEEQRLALATLGSLPSTESLALVVPFLSDKELTEEASGAAVEIAEKIIDRNPAEVARAMKQVQTTNKELAERARKLLARVPAQ
jgi:HEAT repeat protein